MKLIVRPIETYVEQKFTPDSNKFVGAVRPHLYLHNHPAGSLKVQICAEDGTLLAESDEVEMSDITSANYYHGYVRFLITANLMKDVPYLFRVVGINGYTFNESSYCGVCNDYDLQKYPRTSPPVANRFAALDFEIWSRSKK